MRHGSGLATYYEVLWNKVNDTLEQSSGSLRGTGSYTIYLLEPDTLYIVRVRAASEYASTESLPIIIFTGNISSLQLPPTPISDTCPSSNTCPEPLSEGAEAVIFVALTVVSLALFANFALCGYCYVDYSSKQR